jgi:two-component system sensor histidine kinase TtrS
VFARVAQTPAGLGDEVTHRLITLQPGVDDHIWNPPEDYHAVAELYRTLQVGPYAPFTALGLADLAWRQRYVLALAVSAALWWVIHAVRVAQLVRRRTRELELAHESARIQDARMEHAMRLSLMGEMASSLAHEINQPLAAILSYARGCERRLARGEEGTTLRDAIAGIAVQAERAGAIVRRMREFVRKSPGEQVLLEPTAVLRDALALFEPSAAAADVRIESRMPERAPPVRANRLQLEEVVLNLLQNAVESMEGMPDKLVRLAASHEADQFVVVVSDNGPGLTPAAREHLFEAFFTTKPTGLGLGLSLSRSIVEAHGGRLGADEAGGPPGRGASFRFYLPVAAQVDHD